MHSDEAAGASKARNKLAAFLRANGVPVRGSAYNPPEDHDFLIAIRQYAQVYAATQVRKVQRSARTERTTPQNNSLAEKGTSVLGRLRNLFR